MYLLFYRFYSAVIDAVLSLWLGKRTKQDGRVLYASSSGFSELLAPAELAARPPAAAGWVGPVRGRRVVCLADLHEQQGFVAVPPADLMVLAGDLLLTSRWRCRADGERLVENLRDWAAAQPVKAVVVVAGNHDAVFEKLGARRVREIFARAAPGGAELHYLCGDKAVVAGLHVWGSPVSFGKSRNRAFQVRGGRSGGGAQAKAVWRDMPAGLDIAVTHQTSHNTPSLCEALMEKRPRLHVGGHLHYAYGVDLVGSTLSVTASILDSKYKPTNHPIVVDL